MIPCPIPKDHVHRIWSLVEPLVHKVLDQCPEGSWNADVLLAKLLNGGAVLWVCERDGSPVSITVTQVEPHRDELRCYIELHASVAPEWEGHFEGLATIEQWAQDNGCQSIHIRGRRGWKRRLPSYQEDYTVFSKRLDA